jgi:hypothetical protein
MEVRREIVEEYRRKARELGSDTDGPGRTRGRSAKYLQR